MNSGVISLQPSITNGVVESAGLPGNPILLFLASFFVNLAISIVAEVTATTLLTKSEGFSKPIYGLLSLAIFAGCFWALSQVLTRIPVGVTYAIWSGAGVVLISLIGALFLRQSLSTIQMLFIALIVVGAVGLNLTTKAAH